MFAACDRRGWVGGWVLWDWKARLYSPDEAATDPEYALFGKFAERTVATRFGRDAR
jgi:hypothetical protein